MTYQALLAPVLAPQVLVWVLRERELAAVVQRAAGLAMAVGSEAAVELEAVELEAVELEAVELEAVELEAVELEAVELEAVELEAVKLVPQAPEFCSRWAVSLHSAQGGNGYRAEKRHRRQSRPQQAVL